MGKTILISSHILSELADFCTSIGIIERGKLLAAGSIQEIQQQIRVAPGPQGPPARGRRPTGPSTLLRDDPAIRLVESYDHTVTAEFEGGRRRTWPVCSAGWSSSGIVVQSFAEEPLSLEEVFMMITKGIVS